MSYTHPYMGFIEETIAAQHYRDARILTIDEGTTDTQALGLVGRKTLMDQGATLHSLLNDMAVSLQELKESAYPDVSLVNNFEQVLSVGIATREYLLTQSQEDVVLTGNVSVNFMMLLGYLCGGWMMVKAALQARAMLDTHEGDLEFFRAKLQTSHFYCGHLLPRVQACLRVIQAGSDGVMDLLDEQF